MSNSNRRDFGYRFGMVSWVLPIIMSFSLVMVYFILGMAYPSQGYMPAGLLGMAIIFMGSGFYQKTLYDKQCLGQRITELENQIAAQQQELTLLKEKQ